MSYDPLAMGQRARFSLVSALILTVSGLIAGPATAPANVPGLPWTELLPGIPTAANPQPHPIANCRKPGFRCIRLEIKRMRKLRNSLGCDHRAVFATTYMELTKQLRDDLRDGRVKFKYPRYLYIEDALFANVYFKTVRAYEQGRPVAAAWRTAFESAAAGDRAGAQDLLLGINAHVQNDMPFVIASLGTHTRKGASRKLDHDIVNQVLNHAYSRVVKAVRDRYDPSLDLSNSPQIPLDDIAGLEAVRGWREIVWRNAERLLNAKTDGERAQVAAQIEQYAGLTATLIGTAPVPGYGATRDAYCEAQLAG